MRRLPNTDKYIRNFQFLVSETAFLEMPTSESVIVPHELDTVTKQLDERIDSLAYGDEQIRSAALHAAKYIFELCTSKKFISTRTTLTDIISLRNRGGV